MFFSEYTMESNMLIEEVTFMVEVGDFSIHSARKVISRTLLFAEQSPHNWPLFLAFLTSYEKIAGKVSSYIPGNNPEISRRNHRYVIHISRIKLFYELF